MSLYNLNNIWQSDLIQQNGLSANSPKVACPECHKDFVHPRNLLQHQRSVHKQIRYYCSDCDHSYTRQYNLTHHRLKAHPEKMPPAEVKFLKRKPFGTYHPGIQLAQTTANHIKNRALYSNNFHHPHPQTQNNHRRKPATVQRIIPEASRDPVKLMDTSSTQSLNLSSQSSVKSTNSGNLSAVPVGKPPLAHAVAKEGKPLRLGRKTPALPKRACILCPFRTDDPKGLKAHLSKHSRKAEEKEGEEHGCRLCDYKAQSFGGVVHHGCGHFRSSDETGLRESSIPIQKEFMRCMHCDRKFATNADIEKHEKLH